MLLLTIKGWKVQKASEKQRKKETTMMLLLLLLLLLLVLEESIIGDVADALVDITACLGLVCIYMYKGRQDAKRIDRMCKI